MDSVLKDERFARIATDRRFRGPTKKQRKVKVDKRFNSMFKDDRFVSKCTVDKRGRPNNFSSKENYRKYYDLKGSDESDTAEDDDEDEEEDVNAAGEPRDEAEAQDDAEPQLGSDSESDDEDESDHLIEPSIKEKLRNGEVDYARGEGNLYSDSSSDESSEDELEAGEEEEEGEEAVFDKWGELDAEADRTEEVTRRLALCNMDWDRVGAEDIFLALSSFCPSSGCVKQVDVYLSEFGRERLKEEDSLGPQELRRRKEQRAQDEEDYLDLVKSGRKAAKLEKEAMERVRQYQINRLKYYYAVVQFDSPGTANSVYEECDGMEYELSATRFDLRFIPDDMEFEEKPTGSCSTLPNPDQYKPKSFMTTALQQGKVELTWDETDASRQEQMRKAYDAMDEDENVARNLIASSSDEEEPDRGEENSEGEDGEEEETDSISKYRSLLAEITSKDNKAEDRDLEVTWNPEEDGQDEDSAQNNGDDVTETLTPWEKYLKKKKDKKKKKKAMKAQVNGDEDVDDDIPDDVDMDDPFFAEELGGQKETKKKKKKKGKFREEAVEDKPTDLDLLVMDSEDEDNRHFNYKTIVEAETKSNTKKKWKKKKKQKEKETSGGAAVAADNFDVDVNDDRFAAIFSRPEYNIDPSEQNFKKTKGMEKLIGEKQKRIRSAGAGGANSRAESTAGSQAKKSRLDPDVSAALKSVKNKWEKNAKKKKKKA